MAGMFPARTFEEWFAALVRGTPALDKPTITLTRENFEAAMKQSWTASRLNTK